MSQDMGSAPLTPAQRGLAAWHDYMRGEADGGCDPAVLRSLLADSAVFHSPVVHTPQAGADKTFHYLAAAARVLGNDEFRYVRELVDGHDAMLEFTTTLNGIHINGIDLIRFDDDGRIVDFKVMVRPLKAVNMLWEMMGKTLAELA